MRKYIVIITAALIVSLFSGGIYIIRSIEKTISETNNLIMLHQVEILREQLLVNLMKVHPNLYFRNINSINKDDIMSDFKQIEISADACLGCHHSGNVMDSLTGLRRQIGEYKTAISNILTLRDEKKPIREYVGKAYETGQKLITTGDDIVTMTRSTLKRKTESALDGIGRTKVTLYILVILMPVLIAVGAALLGKRITRQFNTILDAIRRLRNGDLDYRISDAHLNRLKDEFREVASAFNDMASRLNTHIQQMQRTEQLTVCGELAAGLAHEIKNPLAGIKIALEVLSDELSLSDEDKTALAGMLAEIRRLESLMKSFLDLSRLPRPQFQVVNINEILDMTINFLLKQPVFSSNNSHSVKIIKDFDKDLPETMADPQQLQQVIVNLILNSLDIMPEGGTITVKTYKPSSDMINIEVSDTGTGINEELMDKIFQPFFTTKTKGTGLGLAISKQIVHQHGGVIIVRNDSGGGATFCISLPFVQREILKVGEFSR